MAENADALAPGDRLQGRTPPGPSGTFGLTVLREEPLRFLMDWTAEYGDIVQYQAEEQTAIILNRPEYAKHVFEDRNQNYLKSGTPELMMLRPMLGEGLMTADGESWLWQRRLTQPSFRRDRIQSLDTLMMDAVETMLRLWRIAATSEQTLDIEAEMTRLTLNIVSRALFGFDLSNEDSHFGQAVQAMNECMAHFDPTNQPLLQRFLAGQQTLRSLVQKIIDQRRDQPDPDADDLLAVLLQAHHGDTGHQLSDRQLQDQIFTFLMAGHETTSKALTWTFYLLDQNPSVAERLRAELRALLGGRLPTSADLPQLQFTGMVIDEAMRLYPPVWVMSRMAIAEDEVGGYRIPAGTLAIVSPYAMHRHPRYWQDPEAFNPDRFAPEVARRRPPYAHFPFSGGPRLCIGRPLAIVETRLVLAAIAQCYTLELVPGHPVEPEALVTLRPRFGMRMTLHPVRT
ncbi:MAG: cytochrome P450 [Dehalococcoidia bacterium]